MESLPIYSVDLITQLDKLYPERCPDESTPERLIWIQAGQRSVVRGLLRQKADLEEDNGLTRT